MVDLVPQNEIPICVDLDGSLVRSDTLLEGLLILIKSKPWLLLILPLILLQGRLKFKQWISAQTQINPESLPFHEPLLSWLRQQKVQGRRLVLATASIQSVADQVAGHVGIFDEVIASQRVNLKAAQKADALVQRFGEQGFDYVGNSKDDLAVWRHARQAIAVQVSNQVLAQIPSSHAPMIFARESSIMKQIWRSLRPHQWAKNGIILIPVLMAHRFFQMDEWLKCLWAFCSFSLTASSVYVLNDLLDLESDRKHATKKKRPFASGQLSLSAGLALVPALLMLSCIFAAFLPFRFFGVLALYFFFTMFYSFWLKSQILLDVLALALLYTMRLLAGKMACDVPISFWLLTFSLFLFFSLALVKRYSELMQKRKEHQMQAHGRGYHVEDMVMLMIFGVTSALTSVLVLALYINSTQVRIWYHRPEWLWPMVPVMLYWVSRIWVLGHRGLMHEDPVLFALRDRVSWTVIMLLALTLIVAL